MVYFVPHVIEHDHDEGEYGAVVHPYGWDSCGEPAEQELALAASNAGLRMLAEWKRAELERNGVLDGMLLVPAKRHLVDVQMVGLARLKFRARSSATAIWAARMPEWQQLAREFEGLATKTQKRAMA
jgi:hypothetical protein